MEPHYYWVNFHVKHLPNEEFKEYVSTHNNVQIYHNPSNKIYYYKSCEYNLIKVTDNDNNEICFNINDCGIVIEYKRDKCIR